MIWILSAIIVGLTMLVAYMSGELRDMRARAVYAENHGRELKLELQQYKTTEMIHWDYDDADEEQSVKVIHPVYTDVETGAILSQFTQTHPGANPHRERGGQG